MTNQAASPTTLQALLQRLEQGRSLEAQGKYKEAAITFNSCLELATSERMRLPITTFCDILLSIAYCYADLRKWDKTLRLYHNIERILRQDSEWAKLVPPEITIALPADYDPGLPLAVLYDSMAIAHDHDKNDAQALHYYRQAIDLYLRLGRKDSAAQTWFYMAVGRKQRQQWDQLVTIGEQMLALANELGDQNGRIKAWQFLAQAHANLNHTDATLGYLKQAVEAEYRLGHPDFERDQAILKDLLGRG